MIKTFYRSLDRTIDIFGLRGSWVRNFLFVVGGLLVLALVFGGIMGTTAGYAIFIVGIVADYFGCIILQQKIPSRRFDKLTVKGKMKQVIVRRETLSHIVYNEPRKRKEG